MKKTNKLLVLSLSLLTMSCLTGCKKDINDLSYRDATGKKGIVASATQYASNVGIEILKKGGNAFDAAAAVGFALGVTEPNATGLGGQGTFLAFKADGGEVKQYNFNAMIGKNQTVDLYDEVTHLEQMKIGPMSVAVPGTVMGLTTLVKDFGSGELTLSEIIDPSIKLCEEGFVLTPYLENTIYDQFLEDNNEEALSMYFNYDAKKQKYTRHKIAGDIITNPHQANVLREIQQKGAEGFYKGWVAEKMLAAVESAHTLTQEDFDYYLEHGAFYSTPLHSTYTATSDETMYDLYSTSTPNCGGVIMLEMLNEIETYAKANHLNLKEMGYDNPEYIHLVASAMQYAYADRRAYVGDDRINPLTGEPYAVLPIKGLISKEYAYDRFTKVFDKNSVFLRTSESDYGEAIGVNPWDYDDSGLARISYDITAPNQDSVGTTSFSVIDKAGNMCCLTFTNSSFWGSYIMPEGCGFSLNNSVTNFNWVEGINQFMPYKNASQYFSPSLALVDGKPYAAFGAPGSEKMPVVQAQVFLNMVEHGMGVNEAVQKGRVFSNRVTSNDSAEMENPDTESYKTKKLLSIEVYDYPESTLNALRAKGYSIHSYVEPGIAAVQAARVNYNSKGKAVSLEGAGDERRGGKALAY